MKDIRQLKKTYLELLETFISFRTVSTDPAFKPDMLRAVEWLTGLFRENGFSVSLLKGRKTNPVIVAKYAVSPSAKTVLVYGHYDVQPADAADGWKTSPFALTKKKDRYIARGAVDNKGQVLAHMVGVFDAIKKKALASNVTFVIEGNEESGNDELAGLLDRNKKVLDADLILVSDGETVGLHPTLDVSYRGGGNIRIEYRTSDNDRHSGIYGGAIPNAVFELATLLGKLKQNNAVALEGFYDGVSAVPDAVKRQNRTLSRKNPVDKLAGVRTLVTESGLSAYEQIGHRPTLEVSGFAGGYTGSGFKNIVPGRAEARINVRTVYPQRTERVMSSIRNFILENTPHYVDAEIRLDAHGDPIRLNTDHSELEDIKRLLVDIHGRELFHIAVGGSIPVVADFQKVFAGIPIAMVSLCNDDCNMHGVNENFSEHHLTKALEFVDRYWKGTTK